MYIAGAVGFRQIFLPALDAALVFVVCLVMRSLGLEGAADRGAPGIYLETTMLVVCVLAVNSYTGLYQRRFYCHRIELARTVLSGAIVVIALQVAGALGFHPAWPVGFNALTVVAIYSVTALARMWVLPDRLYIDRSRGIFGRVITAVGGAVDLIAEMRAFRHRMAGNSGRPATAASGGQGLGSERRDRIASPPRRFSVYPTLFELETGRIAPGNSSFVVDLAGARRNLSHLLLKRVLDIGVGVAILVLSLPITIAVALAIHFTDRGPVFYRQRRVGLSGREFTILKFRSMRVDAEADGKARWATVGDPRVTAIGRFLRRSRIDEIPQVLNILRGDMSIVGPRPERPEIVRDMESEIPLYEFRHTVKPGLTGWAQINFPYGASLDDTIQKTSYDLYYVKNETILLDIIILIATVQVVLRGEGAR